MTQDDKDALLGRLVREEKEKAAHGACLAARAKEIGTKLGHAAELLQSNPARLIFEGEHYDLQYKPLTQFRDSDFPASETIRALVSEIQRTSVEHLALLSQLEKMGYTPLTV